MFIFFKRHPEFIFSACPDFYRGSNMFVEKNREQRIKIFYSILFFLFS